MVAQANAAAGGATYQSVYDAWIAMANRLEERPRPRRRPATRVTARSQYIRAARYYAQALYWVFGTSTPDAEKAVYTVDERRARAPAMKLMATPAEQVADPLRRRRRCRAGS